MYVYSLSTPFGDSILDCEDRDALFAALVEGGGLKLAITVRQALAAGFTERAHTLVRDYTGLTLTIERAA